MRHAVIVMTERTEDQEKPAYVETIEGLCSLCQHTVWLGVNSFARMVLEGAVPICRPCLYPQLTMREALEEVLSDKGFRGFS